MVHGITANTRLLLITVVILFLCGIGAAFGSGYSNWQATVWTVHSHEVIEEIQAVLISVQNIEMGQRGFQLSANEDFLEPYNAGRTSLLPHLEKLASLTADNPNQEQNYTELKAVAEKRRLYAEDVIAKARLDQAASIQFSAKGGGRRLTAEFQKQAEKMVAEEQKLLHKRFDELNFTQNCIYVSVGFFIVIGITMLIWVTVKVQSFIAIEQKRSHELTVEIESRKKTEKALKETTVKLASSNNDLQQFAYVASHDLQEPLRAVVGFLTLLDRRLKDTLEDDTKEWLTHAVDGGQRMRTLVNDLLSYSRVDSQGQALTDDVDLHEVVKSATTNLRAAFDETGAVMKVLDLPKVTGDKTQLTQLFQNLIGNALKYRSPEHKPVIDIAASREGQKWIFSVKDNGIGFDMEHSKRIFVIFQRLHSRGDHPGTGIGLALCKRIIERHGGDIWCESKIGEGSVFYFTIPGKEE